MLSDPWGQVYLEAMKSRAIVVSLNHRALPELTDEGRNAFLIERAAPACLAEAVLAAYATPQDSLEDMAAAAQKVALEQHGWESVADRILSRIGGCLPSVRCYRTKHVYERHALQHPVPHGDRAVAKLHHHAAGTF